MPHISEPDLKPEVAAAARAVLEDAAILQSRWPREISIGRSEGDTPSIYDCFPYLFIEAFPGVPAEKVQKLSLAGRLYASALFLSDALMDQEMKGLKAAVASVNVTALQSEASYILHELFPPGSGFWKHFRAYLRDYIEACLREKEFTIGNRSWSDYTDEVALGIVSGKDGFSRAAIAGLCELSGDDGLLEGLTQSIKHYYIGRQMYDDLIDWKSDLRDGSPSLVLARLLRTRPPVLNTDRNSPEISELARELYYQGHAEYVLDLALDSLDKAGHLTIEVPSLSWRAAIEQAHLHCSSLLSDIKRIVTENRTRVSHQPTVQVGLPEPGDAWLRIGEDALQYILSQWQIGFGEVKHVMKFAHEYGFSSPREFHSGDVFQRALIAEALCSTSDALAGELSDVITHETDYLVASRTKTGVGGWSYFPELPELPPDADDLAQVMQVLFKTGRFSEIEEFCAEPLRVLLTDNYHEESGSFDTWIVPKDNRTPQQELQAEWVRRAWGRGADPDVVANLGWALHLYYADKHRDVIHRAVDFLCSVQDADGKWTSTWYHGPFYGTYVCIRLLSAARPDSDCLPKALDFLLTGQNADGGWGFDENQSDPLSTSLALLTFACIATVMTDERITPAALSAVGYLKSAQLEDGSWPACMFIRMDVGRATGEIWKRLIFARRTITTMYVMKAAFIWWQCPAGNSAPQQLLFDSRKTTAAVCP
jgi:squalene-hopene/tetraprenyl-beta-curcumene cyclase